MSSNNSLPTFVWVSHMSCLRMNLNVLFLCLLPIFFKYFAYKLTPVVVINSEKMQCMLK